MHRITFLLAVAALSISVFSVTRSQEAGTRVMAAGRNSWQEERHYPPLVFTSKATLDCSISSSANGRQIMKTVSGSGFSFDAAMVPIKDGTVKVNGPGMKYKFTSFPASAVKAQFAGLGDGAITEMKAEVEVAVKRFEQLGGPGTIIRFNAADITSDAAYVEFTGLFIRQSDQKPFPFRVVFGSVTDGHGSVLPATRALEAPILTKAVVLGTSTSPATVTTALYEAEDDVRKLQ